MSTKPTGGRVAEPAMARKNMDMSVAKLDAARRILGAQTDTETVDRALDYVIFQGDVFAALDNLSALGGLDPVQYPPAARRKKR